MNDLPVFSTDEDDIFLSFLDYFEGETGLSLNKVSYSLSSTLPTSKYMFKIVNESDSVARNELKFYDDNYVILSKENKSVIDISKLEGYKIGVLNTNLSSVSDYLSYGKNLTFLDYEDITQLFAAFNEKKVDYIVVPKNRYL